MTHLFHPAAGLFTPLTQRLGTMRGRACSATGAALLCLGVVATSPAHAQSVHDLFASEAQERGGRAAEVTQRKDWRNTLDRQEREGERSQQRRKMSEEERSNLRQHLRDASRGAYRDDSPPRKGRR